MFVLQNNVLDESDDDRFKLGAVVESTEAKFEITLCQFPAEDGSHVLKWIYNADLFDEETISVLSNHFVSMLDVGTRSTSDASGSFADLCVSEAEALRIRGFEVGPVMPVPSSSCLHELITRSDGDHVAVVCDTDGEELSYAELQRRTDAVAARLQALGIVPDDIVASYFERNCNMIVSIIGAMKSGGAYVPIDPEYPQERCEFMAEDAGCKPVGLQIVAPATIKSYEDLFEKYTQENLRKLQNIFEG